MRTIVLSLFLVTALALSFQTVSSAETAENVESNESTMTQLATTLKPTSVAEVTGRKSDSKDGMMMNGSGSGGHGNSKKEDALDKISKIIMIYQAVVSTLLMFVDAGFKAKNFGISLITTTIAVVKFIMDLKNYKNNESPVKKEAWGGLGNMVWGEDRLGMAYGTPYRPTYYAHYPTYMQKYKVPS